jgi:hypothetical protein
VLAVTVGATVAALAALSGEGDCSSRVLAGPADSECLSLVRSLSERMGLVAAVATAVIALTMIGLARLASSHNESG